MEKHKCKLCFRSFANGRALGGHMRSHMLNLYVPPKSEQPINQFSEEINSAASSFSEDEEEEEEEEIEERELGYELRENPKKSIRLVDHEFSGSMVVQDRESETESSKNPIRRRSKRIRKSELTEINLFSDQYKKPKSDKEYSPVSSISDTTPEENVAYCLMMLSRDKWMREKIDEHDDNDNDNGDEEDHDDLDELKKRKLARVRSKYRCETCNRVFRSYQALGGHRASHKKIKTQIGNSKIEQSQSQLEIEIGKNNVGNSNNNNNSDEKIHECPVCFRVFSSGQALGGHKRSHVTGSSSIAQSRPLTSKFGERLIDLNLPAPIDDDEISQIELSAVSDAEFDNQIRR